MNDLPLALALLEKDYDCWHVIDLNEGRTGTIRQSPGVSCSKCAGTGKVPLLNPELVRKPCPCPPYCVPYSASPDDQDWQMCGACQTTRIHAMGALNDILMGHHGVWCENCQGRNWVPNPDILDWIRALNKLGLDVAYRSRSPVDEVDVYEDYDILRGSGKTIFEAAAQALGVAPDA